MDAAGIGQLMEGLGRSAVADRVRGLDRIGQPRPSAAFYLQAIDDDREDLVWAIEAEIALHD